MAKTPPAKAVSTHSRPKAAGTQIVVVNGKAKVSTHSRPKAAGEDINWDGTW